MTKRKRFILTSLLLSAGFVSFQYLPTINRLTSVGILGILTVFLFAWSLRDSLGLNMTLFSLVLPFFFTVGVGLFWFLLPTSLLARIPVVIIYAFGIYALALTSNIYTVAAIRTIALLRAARGVGFVITLFTFFLLFDAIFSLKVPVYFTAPSVFLLSLPLFMHGYWSMQLQKGFSKELFTLSLYASMVVCQFAVALFYWPVTVVVGSLFLTVASYMLLGLGQHRLEGRLFGQTVREYLVLGIAVFVGMFLATHWGV